MSLESYDAEPLVVEFLAGVVEGVVCALSAGVTAPSGVCSFSSCAMGAHLSVAEVRGSSLIAVQAASGHKAADTSDVSEPANISGVTLSPGV